jgi:hypothetical protein
MANPKVNEIFVDLSGQPDNPKKKVKPSEAVVWIPKSELETITVTFLGGKTPFCTDVLQAPCRGGCVGALVIGADDKYEYEISVDGVRAVGPEAAPPEIIIDSGSEVPPKGRKSSTKPAEKKSAAKKAAGAKKAGATKKGAKKKAAKKR